MRLIDKYSRLGRLIYTLAPLKPIQFWGLFYYRVVRRLFPFKPIVRKIKKLETYQLYFERYQPNSSLGNYKFQFLNKKSKIDPTKWEANDQTILWHYNLHYFDYLFSKGPSQTLTEQSELLQQWWQIHKSVQGIAWEPYPSSLRAVNLCKWGWLNNSDNLLVDKIEWLDILDRHYQEIKRKLEYHIQANHLFANLKALWFLQAALPEHRIKDAAWLCKQISRELDIQFDSSGGHFELSPMYHRIMLWDLMDMVVIGSQVAEFRDLTNTIKSILPKAVQWSIALSHQDSEVVFFNDSCVGVAPKLDELIKYANFLNIPILDIKNGVYSGYAIAKLGNANLFCDLADVGPRFQPGHAHADSLSFEFSLLGERIIVNSGISEYGYSKERLRQRSTPAHNTITINNKNSSDVWSGFRVGWKANIVERHFEDLGVVINIGGIHNGYKPILHKREWSLTKDSLIINDELGTEESKNAYFYFHPDVNIKQLNNNQLLLSLNNIELDLFVESENHTIGISDSTWHPEFNMCIPNKCLIISFNVAKCRIILTWKN